MHTTVMFAAAICASKSRSAAAICTAAAEYGLAAHWAYKQADQPDGQAGWIRDLVEILETSA